MIDRLNSAPPSAERTEPIAGSAFRTEMANLRGQFQFLEDVDLQTSDLVTRLAETIQTLVELRAKTSLDIVASMQRIEDLATAQVEQQRSLLAALQGDLAAARYSMAGIAGVTTSLQQSYEGLRERIARQMADLTPVSPEPEVEAPTLQVVSPAPPPRRTLVAQPTADTIMMRFTNVDSPATALSLQRFVSRIPGVLAVTGREFGGTRLDLRVDIRGELIYDDLMDWPGGELAFVETAESGAELTVTRLRTATTGD
jgi:hypothetical protein